MFLLMKNFGLMMFGIQLGNCCTHFNLLVITPQTGQFCEMFIPSLTLHQ